MPERQHRPSVRVHPAHLGQQPQVLGPLRGRRPFGGSRRPGADSFHRPGTAGPHQVDGAPQFVTVRGGAYFFLPGIKAIRYLASLGS